MSETPDVPVSTPADSTQASTTQASTTQADFTPRESTFDSARLDEALAPILTFLRERNLHQGFEAAALRGALEEAFPFDGPAMQLLQSLVRAGVEAGALAPREQGGVRFGRLLKAQSPEELSIDCVNMSTPGPGHTHPQGEIDLCFAVSGTPTFDGQAPGWTVYEPASWHVPTVAGGVMDILYFLPGGAIRFEAKPEA